MEVTKDLTDSYAAGMLSTIVKWVEKKVLLFLAICGMTYPRKSFFIKYLEVSVEM